MKRLIPLLLICLLLAGCAADPQPEQEPPAAMEEVPAEPIPELMEAPEVVPEYDNSKPMTGVYVDTSKLTAFQPPQEIYTRRSEAYVDELTPGDYGLLRPYYGSRAAFDMTIYGSSGIYNGNMGLIDDQGAIVVDPVYTSIELLYDRSTGAAVPFYALAKEAWADNEWGGWMSRRYGVCSLDGGMVIPCEYETITYFDGQIAALKSAEEGILHVYDVDGRLLLDTETWQNRPRINYYDGMGTVEITDHLIFLSVVEETSDSWDVKFSLYDWQGNLISDDYDWADLSGEGPYPIGKWDGGGSGYIDAFGNPVLDQNYEHTGSFRNGQAVVRKNGVSYVIDREGNTLWQPDAENLYTIVTENGYYYNTYDENMGVAENHYYDGEFRQLYADAEQVRHLERSRFLTWQNGVCTLQDGERSVVLKGAEDANRDYYSFYSNDIWDLMLVQSFQLQSQEYWLLDRDLNLLASGQLKDEGVELLTDHLMDRSIAVHYSTTGYDYPYDFYVLEYPGAPKLEDVRVLGVYSGWHMVEDDFSSGYMDADGNWLFRVSLMTDMVD